MSKLNWKTLLLVAGVAIIGAALLLAGAWWTLSLPILGWTGLLSFAVLIVLTLVSSRFTVPVTNVDGISQTYKSVADAFIFFAVMTSILASSSSQRK